MSNPFSLFVMAALAVVTLAGCGKEQPCPVLGLDLHLIGFMDAELTSIDIFQLKQGKRTDSLRLNGSNARQFRNADTVKVMVTSKAVIYEGYDWVVSLPNTGYQASITGIKNQEKRRKCGGLLSLDCNPCANAVVSYTLNGQVVRDTTGIWQIALKR